MLVWRWLSLRIRLEMASPIAPMCYLLHQVMGDGKPCILFRARRIALRYQNNSLVDLTQRAFSPDSPVDTRGSVCYKDKAQSVESHSSTYRTTASQSNHTAQHIGLGPVSPITHLQILHINP